MGLLSTQEEKVWELFQKGYSTSEIPDHTPEENWESAYVSRVLNRARKKIEKALRNQANSHRLDVESVQDYKGLLIGFDYQANAQVYMVFTIKLGIIVWYRHDSYAGKLCDGKIYGRPNEPAGDPCPKFEECRETLDTVMHEYNIKLRPDEEQLYMTEQSVAIFNKLAAKEVPRYKRKDE